jgi:hypothetical protein
VSAFANCGRAVAHVRGSCGPRPCEKPKAPDCDRISYSFKTTLGIHTASRFNFEVELENIILGAF